MLSGQINASQMLAAFIGNVKEKLGQKIVKNDFSGELEKHLPNQAKTLGVDPAKAGSAKTDPSGVQSGAATGTSAQSGTGSSAVVQDKGLTASSAKVRDIEVKEKAEKSLSVSNPAVVETILANLHYPAQVRDQCQALLNKQGHITFQDLKSILSTQPDTKAGGPAEVPAATVRSLMESIVKASENGGGKTAAIGAGLMASIGVKPEGSYTRDELRDLLKKIVQSSQPKQTQTLVPSSSTAIAAPTLTEGGQRIGQAIELVSSALPTFLSGESKVSSQKILAQPATDTVANRQKNSPTVSDSQANPASGAPAGANAPQGGDLNQSGSSSGVGLRMVQGLEAILQKGEDGAPKASETSNTTPVQEKQADSVFDRFAAAADLAYAMKGGGVLPQSGSGASGGTSGGVSPKEVESSANQGGQDVAMFGKSVEKLAGGKEQPSETVISQTSEIKSEDKLVTLQQMNNSGGDGSLFYDKNAEAELFAKAGGEKGAGATVATAGGEDIAGVISSYTAASEQSAGAAVVVNGPSSAKASGEKGAGATVATPGGEDIVRVIGSYTAASEQSAGAAVAVNAPSSSKASGEKGAGATVATAGGEDVARVISSYTAASEQSAGAAVAVNGPSSSKASGEKGTGATAASSGGEDIAPVISSYMAASEQSAGAEGSLNDSSSQKASGEKEVGASATTPGGLSFNIAPGVQTAGILNGSGSQKAGVEAAKTTVLGDNPVKDASNVAKSGTVSEKAVSVSTSVSGAIAQGGTSGGGNGASAASAYSGVLSQQEALSMPAGLTDQSAQSGGGQSSLSSSDSSASRSVSAANGTETIAAIEQAMFVRQDGGTVAKRIEEPASGKDSSPALAFAQTSASNLQAINVATADNSGQNGFSMYDPYRAAELVSSMREQMGSGGRLVLEMDSDGLGKINLKVGARKDEITVEALTQSEPARQALVNHSVELRQDLRDQGLVLEKFTVDVNGGSRQGGETGSQAYQSGAQGRGTSGGTRGGAVKTAAAPVRRTSVRTARSQISLFA
ncbi:MAG: flagellar hook-length control protein FliK [Syntrophobacteraceae bacterium]